MAKPRFGGPPPSRPTVYGLPVNRELRAPVLLVAGLSRLGAELLLFPEAHNADTRSRNAGIHQRSLGGVRAILAQRQVVLGRATLVAVAANHDLYVLVSCQIRCSLLCCGLTFRL